ncbi:MAG: hypothetical protein LBD52_05250 [Prevotellaceae bacterium]|nr:hypothetical protein [Prevotellaceae bacterium]
MKTKIFRNINVTRLIASHPTVNGQTRGLAPTAHCYGILLLLFCPVALAAQSNGVTVSGLNVNAGTVTFNVSWEKPMPVSLWSDSVWVFVDYNNAGKMERLPLLPGATLTATSAPGAGRVIEEPGNDQGVWVVGNARTMNSFSATVQLLTATADFPGACAYASNYPPVGEYAAVNKIKFTGTPEYDIVLKHSNGTTDTLQSGKTFLVPDGYTLQSFSDKTGAPGIIKCLPSATHELKVSASSCYKYRLTRRCGRHMERKYVYYSRRPHCGRHVWLHRKSYA